MRVLLIKLTSMGDVIHTLPALNDAQAAIPGIKFTWLVEDGFSEIPMWHSAVNKVIKIQLRNKNIKQILASIKEIRQDDYDLVIDAQGLIKSSLLAKFSGCKNIIGLNKKSARESLASIFYTQKIEVNKDLHAIDRVRRLFASALSYDLPATNAEYGLQMSSDLQESPYIFLLHGTTWESKHWPDRYWLELIDTISKNGYKIKVTWATLEQKQRARAFASYSEHVLMLPHLTISQAAQELNNAAAVVAVDTGFAHLAAALHKPVVAIYGATNVERSGVEGVNTTNLGSKFKCSPCMRKVCNYSGETQVTPACLQEITPAMVWRKLQSFLLG